MVTEGDKEIVQGDRQMNNDENVERKSNQQNN